MTAKTKDGKEVFRQSRIYMPIPQQLGRGDRMGRGPYEKSGLLRDNGLPPNKPVLENFEIKFPFEDKKDKGKTIRTILANEMIIDVELWYLPFGTKDVDPFLWHKYTKEVEISKMGR